MGPSMSCGQRARPRPRDTIRHGGLAIVIGTGAAPPGRELPSCGPVEQVWLARVVLKLPKKRPRGRAPKGMKWVENAWVPKRRKRA